MFGEGFIAGRGTGKDATAFMYNAGHSIEKTGDCFMLVLSRLCSLRDKDCRSSGDPELHMIAEFEGVSGI